MSAYDELVGRLAGAGRGLCSEDHAKYAPRGVSAADAIEAAAAIRALEGERDAAERNLRTVQNAAKTLHNARDTELAHLRENHAFDHRLREEHQSLMDRDAMMTDLLEASEAARQSAEAKLEAVREASPGNAMMGRIIAACAPQVNTASDPEDKADRRVTFEAAKRLAEALASLDKEKAGG